MRFIYLFPLSWLLDLITWVFSPILALFPSRKPNKWCYESNRQYLWKWLHLFSTQDDGVDALWANPMYADKNKVETINDAILGGRFSQWWLRVKWLCRNPAYGFAHYFMAFNRTGLCLTEVLYNYRYIPNREEWGTYLYLIRETNAEGVTAWMLRGEIHYTKSRYIRLYLGWKLLRNDTKVQLATHINPFRKVSSPA